MAGPQWLVAAAQSPKDAKTRHVYVIGDEEGPLKIGVSRRLLSRVATLRGEQARRALAVMASVPRPKDAYAVERVAHKLLAAKRAHGEWFHVTLQEALAAVELAIATVEGVESGSTVQVGFRWPEEIKEALTKAAEDDRRSMSAKAELIVSEWLREHGYLRSSKK